MSTSKQIAVTVGLLLVSGFHSTTYAQKRAIVPSDCLNIRYLDRLGLSGETQISQDGNLLIYSVKAPSASADPDVRQLYMKHIRKTETAKEVLTGKKISQIAWLPDNRRVLMLMDVGGIVSVVEMDTTTGYVSPITHTERDVLEYSVDRDGTTLAFTTPNLSLGKKTADVPDAKDLENGYRISFEEPVRQESRLINLLFRMSRANDGEWSEPTAISFQDPYSGEQHLTGMVGLRNLSMSPDGRRLLFNYRTNHLPKSLLDDPIHRGGQGVTVLFDLQSQRTTLPLPSDDGVWSTPLWARDGQSFIATANPPVGSVWEQRRIAEHRTGLGDEDMYWVSAATGQIQQVVAHAHADHQGPLVWLDNGDVVLQTSGVAVAHYRQEGDSWREISHDALPFEQVYRYSVIGLTTADGVSYVGTYQTPNVPPDLFVFDSANNKLQMLTKLNPQLDALTFAPFQMIHWRTAIGHELSGFLFMPPDYIAGRRYPLVIQTKGNQGWFECDCGDDSAPSFQPQPLADAGIMYLVEYAPEGFNQTDEVAQYPKAYPGQLGEAAYEMEVWESAVASLDQRGLIDPTKVGIIGFSRTGWEVEFGLVHSKVKFAAATATDNVDYSLGEYWLRSSSAYRSLYDAMYGGPPYGKTLKNWLDYSISFNMDKIHTPLLLEGFGYGVYDNVPGMIPVNLALDSEIFVGLSRLAKPVDYYYYPGSIHRMDSGPGHVANLNRNYDWYRFWLQGYEDPDLVKKEQYQRWEHLRDLRDADQKAAVGLTPHQ